MEIDHKISKFRGSKDEYDNLQVLHKICHVNKTRDENTPLITVPKSKLIDDLSLEQFQDFVDSTDIVEGF